MVHSSDQREREVWFRSGAVRGTVANGEWQVAGGRWRMADGGWRMEHGGDCGGLYRMSLLVFLGVRIEFFLGDALELFDECAATPGFAGRLPCGVIAVARIDCFGVLQRLDPTAQLA